MEEKQVKASSGGLMLLIDIIMLVASILIIILFANAIVYINNAVNIIAIVVGALMFIGSFILPGGLKILKPNEALVLTVFGKYTGTLKGPGFFWVNPFSVSINPAATTSLRQSGDVKKGMEIGLPKLDENGLAMQSGGKKISLKLMTLNNNKQKINDYLGNPVEIGIAVIWQVVDTAKAVFSVDNYKEFLSLQCDAALRNIVRLYPYDVAKNVDTTGDGEPDEGSLRGSSEVVAKRIKDEIQVRVEDAGVQIVEARITYLAYAQEIAAVMLQRQQASAIIDARRMIVDGAVGMVEMALDKLDANGKITLDDERKAAMVSNLLVVLCGNKDTQPIVNSGSLY